MHIGQQTHLEASSQPQRRQILLIRLASAQEIQIYINDSDALARAKALDACVTKLKSLGTDIKSCYNEINSVKVTEQYISSLTIIDFLFPLGSMTKAALIVYVKNLGTANLKQAQSDISKLYEYCVTLKVQVIESVNDFAKCEETVKRRTYDELINTTSKITEGSDTPKKEIKEKIADLEAKQKEYVELYGVESQEIKDEIARLKKLYGGVVVVNKNYSIPDSQGREIISHKTNKEGERGREAYLEVLADLDVGNRKRYARTANATWCNIYVWDATLAMGCEIPHYYDPKTGKKVKPGTPGYLEMGASRMTTWLEKFGEQNGWVECDEATAIKMANNGYHTVAAGTNTGHVAMVAPQN